MYATALTEGAAGFPAERPLLRVATESAVVPKGSFVAQTCSPSCVPMNVNRFRVRPGDRLALKKHPPDFKAGFASKDAALEHLQKGISHLESRQELLYAQNEYALLLVFQGMDASGKASGKDSAIKHVMSGVNRLGTGVHTFKEPSSEESNHDYLWHATKVLPARGRIGIFDRSYYENALEALVHPQLLTAQLPRTA
jgi:polyphosphate kinase 2 (PPK2 family)